MVIAEHFFLGRVAAHDFAGHVNPDELERENIRGIRWWPVPEILASASLFAPKRLGELLEPVLRGVYPPTPVVIPELG